MTRNMVIIFSVTLLLLLTVASLMNSNCNHPDHRHYTVVANGGKFHIS